MKTPEEYEKRSDEIADSTRRYVISLNGGGIGLIFTLAASVAENGISPKWAFWPVSLFLVGLIFVGISLFLAKHRVLRRRDATDRESVKYLEKWQWRSFTWDLVAFFFFGVGSIAGILSLSRAM